MEGRVPTRRSIGREKFNVEDTDTTTAAFGPDGFDSGGRRREVPDEQHCKRYETAAAHSSPYDHHVEGTPERSAGLSMAGVFERF